MRGEAFLLLQLLGASANDHARPATAAPTQPVEIGWFRRSAAEQRKRLNFGGGRCMWRVWMRTALTALLDRLPILAALGRPHSDYLPPDAAREHLAAASSETLTWLD